MMITTLDPDFLATLACPACKNRPPLKLSVGNTTLNCAQCSRSYPIEDGIPVLLVDHATIDGFNIDHD